MAGLQLTPTEIRALPEHELAQLLSKLRQLDQKLQSELDSDQHASNHAHQQQQQQQQASEFIAATRKQIDAFDAGMRASERRMRARRHAISLLQQPIVPRGVSDYDGWLSLYTQPLMNVSSIPPPASTDLKDTPVDNLIQRLEKLSALDIVEVNNVPTDHPPNPLPDETEDSKIPRFGTRIGRLGEYGHEIRPIRNLPPSRERFSTLAHKKVLRAPLQDQEVLHFEGRNGPGARWPNWVWTAPRRSVHEEEKEMDEEGQGKNGAQTQTKKKKKPAKRKVAFLDAKRFEPDVGYRPRYLDGDTAVEDDRYGQANAGSGLPGEEDEPIELPAADVFMAPAEVEPLPESDLLVPNPPPQFPYTILVDILRDFMLKNQGVAMAFGFLGQKMSDRGFNYKQKLGFKTMKEMVSTARSSIGFGWTNAADSNASWIWLWDLDKPYRAPSCTTKQWEAFRASREGWEPPGLKQGMINVMRGGVGLIPAKIRTNPAFWAAVKRGEVEPPPPRANTAAPAPARRPGFDHMQWINNSHRRDEVFAASVGPSLTTTNRTPLGNPRREAALSAPPARAPSPSNWRGVEDFEQFEQSDAPALLSSNWIEFGARKREPSGGLRAGSPRAAGSEVVSAEGSSRDHEGGQVGPVEGATSSTGDGEADEVPVKDEDDEEDGQVVLEEAGTTSRFPKFARAGSPDYRASTATVTTEVVPMSIDMETRPPATILNDLDRTSALVRPVKREPGLDDYLRSEPEVALQFRVKPEPMDEDDGDVPRLVTLPGQARGKGKKRALDEVSQGCGGSGLDDATPRPGPTEEKGRLAAADDDDGRHARRPHSVPRAETGTGPGRRA
ncbi:unnamed protein product [Tilletia controversa]|nr:unnamed protein product [Tilletia controversa]CAD6982627.1 unnamed protein product [Tilletia controversa]